MTQAQSAPLGGFFLSPPQDGRSGLKPRRSETGSSRDSLGFIPVSIKQLLEEAASDDSGTVKICGREASSFEIVGSLVSVVAEDTFVKFVIFDGTGTISAKKFIDSDGLSETGLRPGQYVRVVGPLRNFGTDVHISAYRVMPIQTPDEITRHIISVIHNIVILSELHQPKAPAPFAQPVMQPVMHAGPVGALTGESFLAELQRTFGPTGPKFYGNKGFSRDEVYAHFSLPRHEVDSKIQEVMENGHMYSLQDDNLLHL